jgi:hypothetical protein
MLELPWIVHSRSTVKASPSIISPGLRMLRQISIEFVMRLRAISPKKPSLCRTREPWHKEKDAWQNIFEYECCACTNHTGNTTKPPETADRTARDDTVSRTDHTPRERQDLARPDHDHSASNKQEYPESEMDDWDWDELEASPFKGTTSPIQPPTELLPSKNQGAGGGIRQDDYPDQEVDTLDWEALEHPPDRNTKPKLDNTSRPPLNPACEQRQAQWLLCQDTCGCKNSMPNLGRKTRIIQD